MTRTPRTCQVCGVEIGGRQRKYCPDCAEKVQKQQRRELSRAWRKREREEGCFTSSAAAAPQNDTNGERIATPSCATARNDGEPLIRHASRDTFPQGGRLWTGSGVPSSPLAAQKRRVVRRLRLSGEEIDRLAALYVQPDNSYGRMRAYIEQFDAIPPERFLKSAHPNVVNPGEWRALLELPRLRNAGGRCPPLQIRTSAACPYMRKEVQA